MHNPTDSVSPAEAMTRPDGRSYRPRKSGLRARAWENDDESGVIVFGTLDPAKAEAFALESSAYWYGEGGAVVDPDPDWYRDGYQWNERTWIPDERRGAPGVKFTWVHTMPPLSSSVTRPNSSDGEGR